MNSNFKKQAIECIKQAVQKDSEGNYDKAYPLYMNALHYFKTHLEYEKNPKIHEAISKKYTEYLCRAEEIRAMLDGGWTPLNHVKAQLFREDAIEYVKQAVQEDNAGNYTKAFPLYMNALEYFKLQLKFEKDPKIHEAITQKLTEYLRRAEEIRAVLEGGLWTGAPSNTGDLEYVKAQSFKEQAVEYIKQAVQEDNAGNYAKAFSLYMNALEYFKTYFKYEKNPKMHEAVTQKFTEYLRRAEELKAVLEEDGASAGLGTRLKSKPNDGEGIIGGGGDGEENSK
ncbi:MIT [Artemisia annua]|uniref:MIT n=1 Tax=Artemisia annua TaxID=35608 RepID=A0A2U1QDK5_ARTAN|nr:MIT [Artemisia annua]